MFKAVDKYIRAVNFWELLGVKNEKNEYFALVKLCSFDLQKK